MEKSSAKIVKMTDIKNTAKPKKKRRMEREGETQTQEVQPRAQGRD